MRFTNCVYVCDMATGASLQCRDEPGGGLDGFDNSSLLPEHQGEAVSAGGMNS